ncbi:MAG TPA: hypothetical protein VIU41_06990, partial [Geobacteraceae bacterium]
RQQGDPIAGFFHDRLPAGLTGSRGQPAALAPEPPVCTRDFCWSDPPPGRFDSCPALNPWSEISGVPGLGNSIGRQ